jgi:hypothetical protein
VVGGNLHSRSASLTKSTFLNGDMQTIDYDTFLAFTSNPEELIYSIGYQTFLGNDKTIFNDSDEFKKITSTEFF